MVGFAVVITLLCGFALAGAAVDDAKITANQAVAEAEVLEGSTIFRTLVRFPLPNGDVAIPELGVAYPRGLTPGNTVPVEYDVTDAVHVRVAGRSALTRVGAAARRHRRHVAAGAAAGPADAPPVAAVPPARSQQVTLLRSRPPPRTVAA